MSLINSINSPGWLSPIASGSIPKQQLGSFEMNSKEFGSVAAGAIGLVQAAGEAGDTVVNLSTRGLDQLNRATQQAYQGVDDAVDAVGNAVEAVGDAIGDVVDTVQEAASDVVDGIQDGYQAVVDSIEDGYQAVADTLSDAGSQVASYAALGLAAGRHLINELV
jgi:phage-related protein